MGRRSKKRPLKSTRKRGKQKVAKRSSVVAALPSASAVKADVLELAVSSLATIAVEWWRLDGWSAGSDETRLVARHVARRLARFLDDHGLEVVDLTGKPYEAGLAVEVVDSVESAAMREGNEIVRETVSPIVLWKGKVIRQGQVVIGRGAA